MSVADWRMTDTMSVFGVGLLRALFVFLCTKPPSVQCDVYALGVVLYAVLSGGELPWSPDDSNTCAWRSWCGLGIRERVDALPVSTVRRFLRRRISACCRVPQTTSRGWSRIGSMEADGLSCFDFCSWSRQGQEHCNSPKRFFRAAGQVAFAYMLSICRRF